MRRSQLLSLTAIFAALHSVLYFMPIGTWRNWAIYIEPIEGIVLGPGAGFLAAFLGSSIARMIRPDSFWMFGIIAEPIGVLMAGFLSKTRWKPVLATYAIMLLAYFAHPFGRDLPLWAMLDVLFALFLIYPAARLCHNLSKSGTKRLTLALLLVSFVCVATDSLARVFILIPCGLHGLFFGNFSELQAVFVGAAIDSYIEDIIAVIVSFLVSIPLLVMIFRLKLLAEKNNEHRQN